MAFIAKLPDPNRPRKRRRPLRSLPIAPTLMTLGNLLCGFAAIHFALRAMYNLGVGNSRAAFEQLPSALAELTPSSVLSVGAVLVIVGMVFDLLDGLIARVTRSTTNFGGQLDSLADVVTFGVAPATLMVAFMSQELASDSILPSPVSEHIIGRGAWIAAAIYVAFTAIRLARFNVEHAKADFDHRTFHGMPSPGAACVMVALLLFQEQMDETGRSITLYAMPFVAVIVAFLMVSRIPYRRFHRAYFLGKKPFSKVITAVLLLGTFWLIKAPTLLLLVLWYAVSGPLFMVALLVRDRHRPKVVEQAPDGASSKRKRA